MSWTHKKFFKKIGQKYKLAENFLAFLKKATYTGTQSLQDN